MLKTVWHYIYSVPRCNFNTDQTFGLLLDYSKKYVSLKKLYIIYPAFITIFINNHIQGRFFQLTKTGMIVEFVVLALWFWAFLWAYSHYNYKVNPKTKFKKTFYRDLLLAITLLLPVILILF